jgi:septal ring factor EnvC (AmiA/AmiB activator)
MLLIANNCLLAKEIPADMTVKEFVDKGGMILWKDEKIKLAEEIENLRQYKEDYLVLKERLKAERKAADKHIKSLEEEISALKEKEKAKDKKIELLEEEIKNINYQKNVGKIETFGSGMATGGGIILLFLLASGVN